MNQFAPEVAAKFSPLQLELLRTFSFNPTEQELKEVKHMLAAFFFERLRGKLADAADAKGVTDNDLDTWLREKS